MLHLLWMFATVFINYLCGAPVLPPLPMKDGCYVASKEVTMVRLEGEAVILSFPIFERVLEVRKIVPPTAKYIITKENETEAVTNQEEGRVQQNNKQLWLLPARASDSGKYFCSFRNETYCVTGSVKLLVYEASSADMKKLYFTIDLEVGERLKYSCPYLDDFNKTDRLINWTKDSGSTGLQSGREGVFSWENGKLLIPAARPSHAGVYTCQLTVLINNQQYKVSRTIRVQVEGLDPTVTPTVPDLSMTTSLRPTSSSEGSGVSNDPTAHTPMIRPPVIISPLNGTIFETLHGSTLKLFCKVLTECQIADSTMVTWLVNGQSVESSYLDGRALQGGRRVTRMAEGCQIELEFILLAVTEEDVKTELKCFTQNRGGRQEAVTQLQFEDTTFTWLVVAVVAVSCFLTVVSIFLYLLFKPKRKKKMDYFLARQSSTF